MQGLTMSAPAARDTRLRPLVAMRAMRRLMATGDTAQVFVILRAMRGRSGLIAFQRFAGSPVGAAVLRERRDLLSMLSDREGLRALAEGSLGRAYLSFMEAENLSAQGLVEASQQWENDPAPPDVALFRNRMRELHDVNHTVTGYGRDPLGELCLLTFMYRQTGNLGMLLMVAMSWGRLPAHGRKAVREAWRNGKRANWLPGQDWENLLARPLDDVRRDLAIASPVLYRPIAA
jgi:ubiquinone biosynthesis protein COQ4